MYRLLFVIILCGPLNAQEMLQITTTEWFDRTVSDTNLVISTTTGLTGVKVLETNSGTDTLFTRWLKIQNINDDLSLEFRKVNTSGTDSVHLSMECFRGLGTPDSSGISIHLLNISNTDTATNFYLTDSTFVSKRHYTFLRFRLEEKTSQVNEYVLNLNQWSPNRRGFILKTQVP